MEQGYHGALRMLDERQPSRAPRPFGSMNLPDSGPNAPEHASLGMLACWHVTADAARRRRHRASVAGSRDRDRSDHVTRAAAAHTGSIPAMRSALFRLLVLSSVVPVAGCAVVPAYQRGALADPTMQLARDPLEERSLRKLHGAREGAGGGDGSSAGGGCGCGN